MFTDEDLKQAINAGIFSATNDVTATPAAVIRFFEKWAKERIDTETARQYALKEKEYYYLKEGDVIQEGDEVEVSSNFNDLPRWEKAKFAGQKAPDPAYISHRKYRRLKPCTTPST